MSQQKTHISDDMLLAYVDGQLDATAREIVDLHLATHPGDAFRIAEWQNQSEALKALFPSTETEPTPRRLNPHIIATPLRAANHNSWRMAAAAIVLLAFGTTIGWVARDFNTPSTSTKLVTAAVNAHELFSAQKTHAVEVPVEQSSHLTAWLSKTLDRRLEMPDLSTKGYTLLGGRILPASPDPAAQVMYASADGKRISLYLTPRNSTDPSANLFAEVDGLDALYWANDAVTCTIVGDLTRAEMEDIASEVFKALNWQKQPYEMG